jgi:hypothetical protein
MRARRILEGASYGPEVLNIAHRAFDQAWESVIHIFEQDEHESVREDLAQAVIALLRDDSGNVERIRDEAVRSLVRKYPSRFAGGPDERKVQPGE